MYGTSNVGEPDSGIYFGVSNFSTSSAPPICSGSIGYRIWGLMTLREADQLSSWIGGWKPRISSSLSENCDIPRSVTSWLQLLRFITVRMDSRWFPPVRIPTSHLLSNRLILRRIGADRRELLQHIEIASTNLGVGRSNRSGRAIKINDLQDFIWNELDGLVESAGTMVLNVDSLGR